jgi:hypothetical protein
MLPCKGGYPGSTMRKIELPVVSIFNRVEKLCALVPPYPVHLMLTI